MNTILRIFRHDFRGICRNMFALIIALGLCIIPSLYAWFNIYSNWDPYANTSSIKIAVYSEDEGFTPEGKEKQNMGDSIIDIFVKMISLAGHLRKIKKVLLMVLKAVNIMPLL